MRAVRRIMNKPKIPAVRSIKGIVQTSNPEDVKWFIEKNQLGTYVSGTRFKTPLELIYLDKDNVSSEWNIFRFMLPQIDRPLGFLPGQYVTLKHEKSEETRWYCPVNSTQDNGLIDCLVKVYSREYLNKGVGVFTQLLDSLKEGDKLQITEVGGSTIYMGRGQFQIIDQETGDLVIKNSSKVGLISGGTGITTMYQYLQAAEEDPIDWTGFSMLSFYQAPLDALLEEDLSRMENSGLLSYFPVVESPDEMWTHGEGKIRKEFIENFMPQPEDPESHIFISGKPEMNKEWITILEELGYVKSQFNVV